MKQQTAKEHYDLLIQEGNDPANDPPLLQQYMDQWDGPVFLAALNLHPHSNVLEIGVGTGRLAKKVLTIGCGHFTGIDFSVQTLERAAQNLSRWKNKSLIAGDFMTHVFQQCYDIIYCSLTLFHFEDKKSFLLKTAKLLNVDGHIILSVPKIKESFIQYESRQVVLYPDDLETLTPLLSECGFHIVSIQEVAFANIVVAQNKRDSNI